MTDTTAQIVPPPRRRAPSDSGPALKAKRPAAAKPAGSPAPGAGSAPEATATPHHPDPAADRVLGLLTPEQRKALETLSLNLARAAMTAQGAIAEAALRQADRPSGLSPDPLHLAPALTDVVSRLAAQPDRLMRAQADLFSRYLDLWRATAQRIQGEAAEPVATPEAGDRRFADPEWTENPLFDVIKQSYLISAGWLNELVAGAEGVDPLNKRRVEFFMKMLTDAVSPTNFLLSNPAALRQLADTHGESLLKGMENFAADLARGGGQLSISQTDVSEFEVGVNVAASPGKVVFQNELIQLLQFSPTTETVCEIPLLIFPPWINKYYILDLRPQNSMIHWLTEQGLTVFVTSWVNPDPTLAARTFEDYMKEGFYAAVDAVLRQTGAERVNTVGYCIGGTMLSCVLAHMAARGDERIGSATFFAAQQDFSEAGDLLVFTGEDWLKDLEHRMDAAGGVLSGQTMADTFNALRSNDLIWSFFVNNYLMGKEPRPFDLLFWNSDQTRMPKVLHLYYLRKFYGENALAKGALEVGGVKLDLSAVKTPLFVQSSKEDHIAPCRSVYKGAHLFGGPVTFMMAGSGHIAGVINHPSGGKYQYWTNDEFPKTEAAWLAKAVEHPGSWWPHWMEWLKPRSGGQVPARDPAAGPLKAIEDAPGSYVKVRS
jgi:polyhydroxyalkanoate synthase